MTKRTTRWQTAYWQAICEGRALCLLPNLSVQLQRQAALL